ncbi:hypothetical protein AAZX31_05G046800 [Glycine max]
MRSHSLRCTEGNKVMFTLYSTNKGTKSYTVLFGGQKELKSIGDIY